jgi:hypothetical protein
MRLIGIEMEPRGLKTMVNEQVLAELGRIAFFHEVLLLEVIGDIPAAKQPIDSPLKNLVVFTLAHNSMNFLYEFQRLADENAGTNITNTSFGIPQILSFEDILQEISNFLLE